jgi:hypothetical protein
MMLKITVFGIEPTPCRSESERATHYTTAPCTLLESYHPRREGYLFFNLLCLCLLRLLPCQLFSTLLAYMLDLGSKSEHSCHGRFSIFKGYGDDSNALRFKENRYSKIQLSKADVYLFTCTFTCKRYLLTFQNFLRGWSNLEISKMLQEGNLS